MVRAQRYQQRILNAINVKSKLPDKSKGGYILL
jgi:hypothetical protein